MLPHSSCTREHAAYKVSKWQRSSSWLGFPWNMNLQHTDLHSVQLRGVQTFCSFPTSGVIYPRPHYANSGTLNCAWTPSGDCSQQLSVNSVLIKERQTNKLIPKKPMRKRRKASKGRLTAFKMLTASLLSQTGYKTSSWRMDSKRSSSLSASKGGCPAIISYMRTPRAHQSTDGPYSNSWRI